MKQLLICLFTLLFCNLSLSQKQDVFENKLLPEIIPEVESFYNVKFSYVDNLIKNKSVSILLDEIVPIESLILTLSSQTSLKFEIIDNNYVVISNFNENDLINICGQLYSKEETIENASIQIGDQFYTSDKNGYFFIKNIPYGSSIKITSFGIKESVLNAADHLYPNCKNINLAEKRELLDQVVINEYLTSGITKNVKQTTIHSDKLKILPGLIAPDILESIHQIPGVSNPNETVSSIHVRGGNADQNLVLWNNIKTYNNSHLFGAISAFNPYIVDKVHFINKGTSAKYGERISSVIDIKSNYQPAKKLSGGAGFNMLHGDAYVDIPLIKNELSVLVSGRRSYADAVETFTYKNLAKHIFQNTKIFDPSLQFSKSKNIFWFHDYTVNAAWKASKTNLIKINHLYNENYLNFSALSNDQQNLYIDELDTQNIGYNIEWEKEWSPNLSHQLDTYFSKYLLKYSLSDESIAGTFSNNKENLIKDFGINFNVKYDVAQYKQLNFGYQFTNKNFSHLFQDTAPTLNIIVDEANNTTTAHGLFAEYQVNKPLDHLFSIGLRANKYSSSKEYIIEPRAIVQKFVTPEFSINGSLEYKSQFLSQVQESIISDLSLENHVWALSNNDNFPILKSYQYTIGGNYTKNKWIIDVEAYFKRTKGINSLNLSLNNPIFFDYQIGNSSIQGVDFFFKKQMKNYNTWLSYSFNNAKYIFPELNDGKSFPSNINIDHTIKWSHFYKWKNIEFSLGWIWHNGKPFTKINASTNPDGSISYSYSRLNAENLPVYHRLDFSAVYDFKPHRNKTIKYRLGLSVINLYDRKNIINKDIRFSNANSNELNISNIQSTGITPNLVLRIFW